VKQSHLADGSSERIKEFNYPVSEWILSLYLIKTIQITYSYKKQ